MISPDQSAALSWRDDVIPVSTRFDDPYFSLGGGLAETRHVFLGGNDLPARFVPGFHVAELGFGTGLNLLATLIAWRSAGSMGLLRYTSFEAYPMTAGDMARALAAFPEALAVAGPMLEQWAAGKTTISLLDLEAEVILGDAGEALPAEWPPEPQGHAPPGLWALSSQLVMAEPHSAYLRRKPHARAASTTWMPPFASARR